MIKRSFVSGGGGGTSLTRYIGRSAGASKCGCHDDM